MLGLQAVQSQTCSAPVAWEIAPSHAAVFAVVAKGSACLSVTMPSVPECCRMRHQISTATAWVMLNKNLPAKARLSLVETDSRLGNCQGATGNPQDNNNEALGSGRRVP